MRSAALLIFISACNAALGSDTGTIQARPDQAFLQLADAARFLANYKEMAAVSVRVSASLEPGDRNPHAAFMAKVAVADLSDMRDCMGRAYASGPVTQQDAVQLVRMFTSPLGKKILDIHHRGLMASLDKDAYPPVDWSSITEEERTETPAFFEHPAFKRYGALISSRAFDHASTACLVESKIGKATGFKG
ncbi:hypothetical protein INH39_19560 [Massilia violaceinigra]|uniref:DUF2059 domain-containing protein n=1 Tax=Massilia violaceinigra TaxID=2045208 RepID=A0ABY3ZZ15_9BURK|nr:hypothetical protein [Massilia violaceinigra]UOD27696.1 hypothetical protein INH39_19560 [Massilia violaceinigra]